MEKIGVIINPHAKKIRLGKIKIDDFKTDPEIVELRLTQTLDAILDVAKDFKKNGVTYVGIAGGDGSMHHVIQRLIQAYSPDPIPPLVILKGGTMDNIARTINLKGKGPAILKRLVKAIRKGKKIGIFERDTMQIGNTLCFLFGTGMVTNFLNEVYKGEKGFRANVRVTMKGIKHSFKEPETGSLFHGFNGDVLADGEPVPFKDVCAILAGTVEHISGGMPTCYRANEKPGTFHAIITGLKRWQIFGRIYFLFGFGLKHKLHRDVVISSMKIRTNEKFEYTMDGDMYQSDGVLEIKMGPRVKLVKV